MKDKFIIEFEKRPNLQRCKEINGRFFISDDAHPEIEDREEYVKRLKSVFSNDYGKVVMAILIQGNE